MLEQLYKQKKNAPANVKRDNDIYPTWGYVPMTYNAGCENLFAKRRKQKVHKKINVLF